MRDFLTYGIYDDGTPTEGTHYFNFGMGSGGSMSLVAMARRGDNLLQHPHLYALRNWYTSVIEPFGVEFAMHGDTPNANGGLLDNYVLMKNLWPDDPVIDFIWRNRVGDKYTKITYRGDFMFAALFPQDWQSEQAMMIDSPTGDKWGADAHDRLSTELMAPWTAPALNLPLTHFSSERGFLVTRTGWNRNDMALHVECRRDAIGPGHQHSNQNDFTLSALGRQWVVERGFHRADTAMHSCILIDGKGQGNFTAPGRFITYLDHPFATAVVGDARDAYTYRHTFSWRPNIPGSWSPSPINPNVIASVYNPVQYAFRSVIMVRGDHPYLLIVDDVRKDDAPHLYQFLLQVPDDLELASVEDSHITLQKTSDQDDLPSLLVEVLEPGRDEQQDGLDIALETYDMRLTPESGHGKIEKFGLAKRLSITGRRVAMSQVTLLIPLSAKDEKPIITKGDYGIVIEMAGQKDLISLARKEGKPTGISIIRNDNEAILVMGQSEAGPDKRPLIRCKRKIPALAWMDGTASISGDDWNAISINNLPVTTVNHDGSLDSTETSGNTTILTEKETKKEH